jgi:hypothetical protein
MSTLSQQNDVSSFHGEDVGENDAPHAAHTTTSGGCGVDGEDYNGEDHIVQSKDREVMMHTLASDVSRSPNSRSNNEAFGTANNAPSILLKGDHSQRSSRGPSVDTERIAESTFPSGYLEEQIGQRVGSHDTLDHHDAPIELEMEEYHGPDDHSRALQVSPNGNQDKYSNGGGGQRRPSSCLVSLRLGVFILVAAVIGTAGFTHLATLAPNSSPIEHQGVLTYRTTLAGAGETILTKILNELSMVVQIAGIAYFSPRVGYNITEDPSTDPTWDIGLHKWFLGEANLHPERRFCYIDAGSWAWSCQHLRSSLAVRVVGN